MAITRKTPTLVLLHSVLDNPIITDDLAASAAISYGYLIERHSDSGVLKWKANASATNQVEMAVALDEPELNQGLSGAYAAGDLVKAWHLQVGDVFYGVIPSGQDIAIGDLLQSNGDGKMKEATAATADANVARFRALSAPGAVTADTRVKVERIN